jgi:hypothetical protein
VIPPSASSWTPSSTSSVDRARLAGQGQLTDIGLLRHGTGGGRASVSMLVTLPDGTQVFAETTWRLLKTAVRALAASPIAAEEVGEP